MVNQDEIHRMAQSEDVEERREAAWQLRSDFANLLDKEHATNDLLTLTKDEDCGVRRGAAYALGHAFQHVTDKEQATKNLLVLTKDDYNIVRMGAAEAMGSTFIHVTDKKQATKNLLVLTKDEDEDVRWQAVISLGFAFPHVTDKEQVWKNLISLTKDEDENVQYYAASALSQVFSHVMDKQKAWKDLLSLTKDETGDVQWHAASPLESAFPYVTDKEEAWKDLILLTKYGDERWHVASSLGSAFEYMTDKEQATKDLLVLTKDEDEYVRSNAVIALGSVFPHVKDKEQVWDEFLYLTEDEDKFVRRGAASAIGSAFPYVADKARATKILLALAKNKNSYMRIVVAIALSIAFPHVTDKEQATNILLALAKDENCVVRNEIAYSLYHTFIYITKREKATKILIDLVKDKDSNVRWRAVSTLGHIFPYVTDKKEASKALLELTKDEDNSVRWRTADALGSAYPHFTDKELVTKTLLELTKDEGENVCSYAYYSLGKISIIRATEADEENLKKELEKALEYFEKSESEVDFYCPTEFCFPFYRAFHAITFKKEDADTEVKDSIEEAKQMVLGFESREKLLEAIENLSIALTEAKKARSIGEIQGDLTVFSRYRAVDLLDKTEGHAPIAVKLIRDRGLPIIDEKIKKILADVEEKFKEFYKDSNKTPFENISRNACQQIEGLKNVDSEIEAKIKLNALSPILRSISNTILPEESNKVLSDQLDEMEVAELCDKAKIIQSALIAFHPQIINLKKTNTEKDIWIEYLRDGITQRLDNINFGVFKIKHRSAEMSLALNQVQTELKKINKIKNDLDNIGINLEELGESQNQNFQELNDGMKNICNIIESEIIPKLPENDDKQIILDKIDELKQSDTETLFNRVAGFSSIIGLILPLLL